MSEVGRLSLKIDADAAGFHSGMQGVQQKLGQVGEGMKQFGGMMTRYVTLPLLGVATAAFKMGKDFEFEMQKIVGLVGVSKSQVDEWSKSILEMAPELGKAPKELAEALYFITSAGIDAADAMTVLELAAKASASGLGETKVVADLVTSAMNAYGSEVLSAEEATNILLRAVRLGKAAPEELAAAMGAVLPIASEMGVEFWEVAGAIAAMSRTGTDAHTATTQLKQILASLLKPAEQAEKALRDMGTSSAELRQQIKDEGLLTVLMRLKDLTNEYGEDVMAKVFPNIRALMGILDLMGANMEDNIAIMEEMGISTDDLSAAFAGAADTAEFKFQQAMAQVQTSLIELWEVMEGPVMGIMEDLVTKLEEVTAAFKDLDEEQQEQIIKWGGIFLAIGPVVTVLGNLALFLKFVLIPILGTPAGLVAAFGLVELATLNWREELKETHGELSGFITIIESIFLPFSTLIRHIKDIIDAFKGGPRAIMSWLDPFKRLEGHVRSIMGWIQRLIDRWNAWLRLFGGGGGGGGSYRDYEPAPIWRGTFDSGGVVPGPIGKPGLALVHGGETILPTHKTGASGLGQETVYNIELKVGTLIADNHGLKELERRLKSIRYMEAVRGVG